MEDQRLVRVLTTYSAISAGILAAVVAIGFVVQVRLTELLGIELPTAPTDYFAAAGDFLLSLLVRLMSAVLLRDCTFTRTHLVILIAAGLAIVLGLIVRRITNMTWRTYGTRLCYISVIVGAVALLTLTMSLLRLRNVLQPANTAHMVQRLQQVETLEPSAAQRIVIAAYQHGSSTLQEPLAKASFNPSSGNTAAFRQNVYAGTIVVAALLLAALCAPPRDVALRFRQAASVLAWTAVLVGLPLAYATLGRTFTYPIVRVTSTEAPTVSSCGYLLATDATSITLYDRLGGFRIRRIPREHLLIDQRGAASPFDKCGAIPNDPQGFLPCETQFCP